METVRTCDACEMKKPINEFRLLKGKYYTRLCKKCLSKQTMERIKNNKESERKFRATKIRTNRRLKKLVFEAYGGKCVCCGESDYRFLTLDHKDGGGREHRKSVKKGMDSGGSYFYRWVRDSGFPDDLQLMCYNCNCGRQANGGVCPHKDPLLSI